MFSAFAAMGVLAGTSSANACERLLLQPDAAERAAVADAVGKAAQASTSASAIDTVMGAEGWRAVWAAPVDREPGVFVFRRLAPTAPLRFVDVWGGAPDPDGSAVVMAWARKLHMPRTLAACVANRISKQGP